MFGSLSGKDPNISHFVEKSNMVAVLLDNIPLHFTSLAGLSFSLYYFFLSLFQFLIFYLYWSLIILNLSHTIFYLKKIFSIKKFFTLKAQSQNLRLKKIIWFTTLYFLIIFLSFSVFFSFSWDTIIALFFMRHLTFWDIIVINCLNQILCF